MVFESAARSRSSRMSAPTFDPDDRSYRREWSARRGARLAVYSKPIPEAVQRALAIEDGMEAAQRASFAAVDGRRGETDEDRVERLRLAYFHSRMALDYFRGLSDRELRGKCGDR